MLRCQSGYFTLNIWNFVFSPSAFSTDGDSRDTILISSIFSFKNLHFRQSDLLHFHRISNHFSVDPFFIPWNVFEPNNQVNRYCVIPPYLIIILCKIPHFFSIENILKFFFRKQKCMICIFCVPFTTQICNQCTNMYLCIQFNKQVKNRKIRCFI